MRRIIAVTGLCGLLALTASGQETKAPGRKEPPKKISAAEAEKHYQETLTVTGKVAQVTIREKLVYLNLDKKFPETPFTAVIFGRTTNQFGDLKKLEGKLVEVTGKIDEYKAKAQIVLNSSNQLQVIDQAAKSGDSDKK